MENQYFNNTEVASNNSFASNSSNPITGFIGAVIGSCLGVAAWVLIYKIGFITAVGGIAIMAGAVKGYEILGAGFDNKGRIICIVISLVMVFVANYLSWAVEWYEALNKWEPWSFSEVLPSVFEFNETTGVQGDFIKDLIMGYLLSIVAIFSYVRK